MVGSFIILILSVWLKSHLCEYRQKATLPTFQQNTIWSEEERHASRHRKKSFSLVTGPSLAPITIERHSNYEDPLAACTSRPQITQTAIVH